MINEALIEKYIGISKQYKVFELQRAMGLGDMKKTMTIANYVADNVKDVHPVMIVGSLYNYLSKLLIVGMNKGASDKVLQTKLRLPTPYFVREYKGALRYWNGKKVLSALQLLSHYDLRVKGVNNRNTELSELVKEMIFRLMTV
jgi:DNA polymerase-3 subunit delta